MTKAEFAALCDKFLLSTSRVLENEAIREALRANDAAKVERLLLTEF